MNSTKQKNICELISARETFKKTESTKIQQRNIRSAQERKCNSTSAPLNVKGKLKFRLLNNQVISISKICGINVEVYELDFFF